MRGPFLPADLAKLGDLLEQSDAIVPMEDIYDNQLTFPGRAQAFIGMRHDCDNVIHPAINMARWEEARGYRSTYYILHTAPYWRDKTLLRESLDTIASCGHEIGLHNDAITVALETGLEPAAILDEAVTELRSYGYDIRSTVGHGNHRCHVDHYCNDEMFTECYRDDYGDISRLGFTTTPLAEFGFDFDSIWLPRGDYLSDSGGQWSQPFDEVAAAFPTRGQLHMLVHPDWWGEAFERTKAAA